MLLTTYLLRTVLLRLALVLLVLVLIVLGFELGDQGRLLARSLGWAPVLVASFLHLPLAVVQMTPLAVLLAEIHVITSLRQRGELEAIALVGVSPARRCLPFILSGLLGVALTFLLNELVVPPCEQKMDLLLQGQKASSLTGARQHDRRWLRWGHWFLHLERHSEQPTIIALELDDQGRPRQRLDLVGTTNGTKQQPLLFGKKTSFPPHGAFVRQPVQMHQLAGLDLHDLLALWPEHRSRAEAQGSLHLRRTIQQLSATGQEPLVERLVLHIKLAFPWLSLVLSLWSCLLLFRRRRPSLRADYVFGFVLAFLSWLLLALGWSAGRVGWIAPNLAAWSPLVLGLVLGGGWLLKMTREVS